MRRVAITGMGIVSTFGTDKESNRRAFREGRSGIRRIQKWDPSSFKVQIGGEVLGFEPTEYMDAKEARRLDPFSQYAVACSRLALDDAGFKEGELDRERASERR